MSLVSLGTPLVYGGGSTLDIVTPAGFNTVLIDAVNEFGGFVFIPLEDVTVRKIAGMVTAVSAGTWTLDCRVETVDPATGNPTGTQVGSSGNVTPAASGWLEGTLSVDASLTKGTAYWIGFRMTARTSGSVTIARSWAGIFYATNLGFPYGMYTSTGVATTDERTSPFSVEKSDGTKLLIPGVLPGIGNSNETFNSGSNPNRRGLRFKVAVPCRLVGVHLYHTAASDFTLILYGSDGTTILDSRVYDKDIRSGAGVRHSTYPLGPVTLSADTFYRVVILPGDTTNRLWLHTASVQSAADLNGWPAGEHYHLTTVNGAPANEAAWTNTLTTRPIGMAILLDQFDNGAGAGGGGGLRLVGHGGLVA